MIVYEVQVKNRISFNSEKWPQGEISAYGGEISTIWRRISPTFGGECVHTSPRMARRNIACMYDNVNTQVSCRLCSCTKFFALHNSIILLHVISIGCVRYIHNVLHSFHNNSQVFNWRIQ